MRPKTGVRAMGRRHLMWAALAAVIGFTAGCGGPPFTSVGTLGDASTGGGDASIDASMGGVDATAQSDAAFDVATDASRPPAAGRCGPISCAVGETCFVYVGASAQYDCRRGCPLPQNGDHLSALQCSGAADCVAGAICCIERLGNDNRSSCAIACASNQAQLCDPSAAATGCTASAPCSTTNITDWNLPVTFGTCGGVSIP